MQESLITFKTAKLAKEKGFDIKTLHFYCKNKTCNYIETPYKYSFEVNANQGRLVNGEINNFGYGITWSAPTQALLQKWLREVHRIYVYIKPIHNLDINGSILDNWEICIEDFMGRKFLEESIYINGYEEALEVGLQESLKLIKV